MNTRNIIAIAAIFLVLISSTALVNTYAQTDDSEETKVKPTMEPKQTKDDIKEQKQQSMTQKKEMVTQARKDQEKSSALGIAVTSDGTAVKSYVKLWMAEDDTGMYKIQKGTILIMDKSRDMFKFIPDTWANQKIDISSNFDIQGKAQDRKGNVVDLSLKGEKLVDLKNGSLYTIKGKTSGENPLEMYYLSPQMRTQ